MFVRVDALALYLCEYLTLGKKTCLQIGHFSAPLKEQLEDKGLGSDNETSSKQAVWQDYRNQFILRQLKVSISVVVLVT